MPCDVAGVRAAVEDTNKTAKIRIYLDTPAKPQLQCRELAACNTLARAKSQAQAAAAIGAHAASHTLRESLFIVNCPKNSAPRHRVRFQAS